MAGMNKSGTFFRRMLLLLLLVELRRSSALCPPSCPTTVKEITTKPHDPTTIPGYATDSTNANNLECFKCDSFQSSLDECKGEQTDGTSVCQNGQWCFINVVYRDIASRDDVLRYERGCWDEAMCDDAAKNNEENLAKESCIQQNGTYVCHKCCNRDTCNGVNLNSGESLNFKIFAFMVPIINIIWRFL